MFGRAISNLAKDQQMTDSMQPDQPFDVAAFNTQLREQLMGIAGIVADAMGAAFTQQQSEPSPGGTFAQQPASGRHASAVTPTFSPGRRQEFVDVLDTARKNLGDAERALAEYDEAAARQDDDAVRDYPGGSTAGPVFASVAPDETDEVHDPNGLDRLERIFSLRPHPELVITVDKIVVEGLQVRMKS